MEHHERKVDMEIAQHRASRIGVETAGSLHVPDDVKTPLNYSVIFCSFKLVMPAPFVALLEKCRAKNTLVNKKDLLNACPTMLVKQLMPKHIPETFQALEELIDLMNMAPYEAMEIPWISDFYALLLSTDHDDLTARAMRRCLLFDGEKQLGFLKRGKPEVLILHITEVDDEVRSVVRQSLLSQPDMYSPHRISSVIGTFITMLFPPRKPEKVPQGNANLGVLSFDDWLLVIRLCLDFRKATKTCPCILPRDLIDRVCDAAIEARTYNSQSSAWLLLAKTARDNVETIASIFDPFDLARLLAHDDRRIWNGERTLHELICVVLITYSKLDPNPLNLTDSGFGALVRTLRELIEGRPSLEIWLVKAYVTCLLKWTVAEEESVKVLWPIVNLLNHNDLRLHVMKYISLMARHPEHRPLTVKRLAEARLDSRIRSAMKWLGNSEGVGLACSTYLWEVRSLKTKVSSVCLTTVEPENGQFFSPKSLKDWLALGTQPSMTLHLWPSFVVMLSLCIPVDRRTKRDDKDYRKRCTGPLELVIKLPGEELRIASARSITFEDITERIDIEYPTGRPTPREAGLVHRLDARVSPPMRETHDYLFTRLHRKTWSRCTKCRYYIGDTRISRHMQICEVIACPPTLTLELRKVVYVHQEDDNPGIPVYHLQLDPARVYIRTLDPRTEDREMYGMLYEPFVEVCEKLVEVNTRCADAIWSFSDRFHRRELYESPRILDINNPVVQYVHRHSRLYSQGSRLQAFTMRNSPVEYRQQIFNLPQKTYFDYVEICNKSLHISTTSDLTPEFVVDLCNIVANTPHPVVFGFPETMRQQHADTFGAMLVLFEQQYFRRQCKDYVHFPDWVSNPIWDYCFGVFLGWILKTQSKIPIHLDSTFFRQLRLYLDEISKPNSLNREQEVRRALLDLQYMDPQYYKRCCSVDYNLSIEYRVPYWHDGVLSTSERRIPGSTGKTIYSEKTRREFQEDLSLTICGLYFRTLHAPGIIRGFDSIWNLARKTVVESSSGIRSLLALFNDRELCDLFSTYQALFKPSDMPQQVVSLGVGKLNERELAIIRSALCNLSTWNQYRFLSRLYAKYPVEITTAHSQLDVRHGSELYFIITGKSEQDQRYRRLNLPGGFFQRDMSDQLITFAINE
jgi:hypothetical protein